jgi:hypothetical protein
MSILQAKFATAAYNAVVPDHLKSDLDGWGTWSIGFLRGIYGWAGQTFYFATTGTRNRCMAALDLVATPSETGWHEGFGCMASVVAYLIGHEIIPQTGKTILAAMRDRKVEFIGHSAGGAIAILLPILLRMDPSQATATVFGCPYVIADKRGSYPYKVIEYQAPNDVIPHVPAHRRWARVGQIRRVSRQGVLLGDESWIDTLNRWCWILATTIGFGVRWLVEWLPCGERLANKLKLPSRWIFSGHSMKCKYLKPFSEGRVKM